MSQQDQDTDKSFDATPQKIQKAREKGEVVRSTDVITASSYLGFLVACVLFGSWSTQQIGSVLQAILTDADRLSELFFEGSAAVPSLSILTSVTQTISPFFALPIMCAVLAIFAQQAFLFTPSKITPKASRISLVQNAKNRFGRNGLFEFSKSATKLIIYSGILGAFIYDRIDIMIFAIQTWSVSVVQSMVRICIDFLTVILIISIFIGAIDWLWQNAEHLRKNRMSRKEIADETKESEGDPYLKLERRQRAQSMASNRMLTDVPQADVIIVNPTHYAVALRWTREPGSAPVCVAKGVDEIAAAIRRVAIEADVPIYHDPPTARTLHANVEIGSEIFESHYRDVAVAIQFAARMRERKMKAVL